MESTRAKGEAGLLEVAVAAAEDEGEMGAGAR